MRMGIVERRARMGVRHRLAARHRGRRAEEAAESVVALHATDAASVFLAARARMAEPVVSDVERALYENRTLVRMLGMRRTMFVLPAGLVPIVQAACTAEIADKERRLLVKQLSECGHPDNVPEPARWLAEVEESTVRALEARGESLAQDLPGDEPRLRQKLVMARGKPYESIVNVTGRVLSVLAADGRIMRGRPRGSWQSTQYAWSPAQAWLGEQQPWEADAARAELTRRWLSTFGPAPVTDLRWWTGWPVTKARKALADVGAVEVELDDGPGFVLADDLAPEQAPEPWVAMLPALDPTTMGWSARDWYLDPGHRGALFDRNGNIGPTVVADGKVIGGWAQRGGEVVYRLLEDTGSEVRAAVDAESERLTTWLDGARIVPKFRTPLEREITDP